MKAVMLAGECGYMPTRSAGGVPRGLWPVFDRPAASHLVEQLLALGCDRVGVCANGDCSLFAEALNGRGGDATAVTFVEDRLPRGAAGCAADVARKLGRDRFLVLQTNMLWDARLPDILIHHLESNADLTVVVKPDNTDNGLTPVGIYIFEPCVFDFIRPTSYQDIKEQVIPDMVQAGRRVDAFALPDGRIAWYDTGTYIDALGRALSSPQRFGAALACMRQVAPSVYIAPDAHMSPSARVFGPAALLKGASMGSDAVLIGPVVVGPHSRVGRSAVVSESILWSHVTIKQDSYITRSVIGDGAVVSTAVANRFVPPSQQGRGRHRARGGTRARPAKTADQTEAMRASAN